MFLCNSQKIGCVTHLLAAIVLIVFFMASASNGALSDCIDATCRVTAADGGVGSGCVFEISQGRVFVLTAAHVVGKDRAVRCEFWRQGHQSLPLAGQVIARSESADAAIIAVPEELFGGLPPGIIPIAPRGYVVPSGAALSSVGCANGAWSTGWKGHALGCDGANLRFLPTPANGRSGSAVFDEDGKMIVGLLRARTIDNSEGIATPAQSLYDAFSFSADSRRSIAASNAIQVQCPGGSCPNGTCPITNGGAQSDRNSFLLPYRQKLSQDLDRISNTPYPTLPTPAPGGAKVDLEPILQSQRAANEQLNAIANMLAAKFNEQSSQPAQAAQPGQADGESKSLLQKIHDKIEAKNENSVVGKFFDKFADNGPGLFVIGVTIFLCVFFYKIVHNKPLLAEKIAPDSLIGQHAKELRESLAEKLGSFKNEFETKLQSVKQDVAQASNNAQAAADTVNATQSAKNIAAEVAKSVASVTQKTT
jgi:hypothetical protein